MKFLDKLFGQKLLRYIILFIFGFVVYYGSNIPDLTNKQVGMFIIIISALGIIYEAKLRFYIKTQRKDYNFKSRDEAFIAKYLEDKKIKYVYNKKVNFGLKKITCNFFLPEFDIYLFYWPKQHDYKKRKEIEKEFQSKEIPIIEVYYDNLVSKNQLDWKFTERLLNILKKERSS